MINFKVDDHVFIVKIKPISGTITDGKVVFTIYDNSVFLGEYIIMNINYYLDKVSAQLYETYIGKVDENEDRYITIFKDSQSNVFNTYNKAVNYLNLNKELFKFDAINYINDIADTLFTIDSQYSK